jgi:elongator complex protein 3
MLTMGGTRVELGVQTIDDNVYRKVQRGHSVDDVVKATAWLKDSAFKVGYHLMPGLPFTDSRKELKQYKSLFKDERFQPDMIKIYPCLVIEGTKLYDLWQKGDYTPFDEKKAVKLIANLKASLPPWVRVMRIQRDIPANLITAGVKASNLRQLVEAEMKKKGLECGCIRCREAGLQAYKGKALPSLEKLKFLREDYSASQGQEIFLSAEEKKKKLLYGFCRLRIPRQSFRKEIDKSTALIRELHVYSPVVAVGKKAEKQQFQHQGIGRQLLREAEKIAREEFDCQKMVVISGVGAREYYQGLGYGKELPFVSKQLQNIDLREFK